MDLPLPDDMILLVEVGSTAHGTGLPGHEDTDQIAVVMERASEIWFRPHKNKMQRTAPGNTRSTPSDIDRQVYSLREFARLAMAGNPSVLLALWAPVIAVEPYGQGLLDMRKWFVGRHIIPKYRGYMHSQMLKLDKGSHPVRGAARREIVDEHGFDTKFAMHACRLGFQAIELLVYNKLTLPIEPERGDWLRAVRRGEVSLAEVKDRVADLDEQLYRLSLDESLPAGPNREMIESFVIGAQLMHWGVPSTAFSVRNVEIVGRLKRL